MSLWFGLLMLLALTFLPTHLAHAAPRPATVRERIEAAMDRYRSGNYAEAVVRFDELLEPPQTRLSAKESGLLRYFRGVAHFHLGHCNEARRDLEGAATSPIPVEHNRTIPILLGKLEAPCSQIPVQLTLVPAASRVFVDGQELGPAQLEGLRLTPGRHRIRLVSPDGVERIEETLEVAAPGPVERRYALPAELTILIESVIGVEEVRVDEQPVAGPPWVLRLEQPAAHQVLARGPGGRETRQPFTLAPGERRTVTVRFPAYLTLTSEPSGCEVTVDGEPRGVTPLSGIEVPAGVRALRVRCPEGQQEERLELGAGQALSHHVTLPRRGCWTWWGGPCWTWWTAAGGAALLLAGGGVWGWGALDYREVEQAAVPPPYVGSLTQQEADDLTRRGDDKQRIGTLLLGGGAVALGVGLAALLLADSPATLSGPRSDQTGLQLLPAVGHDAFGFTLRVRR